MSGDPLILSEHDAAVHTGLQKLRATLLHAVEDIDELLRRVVELYNPKRAAAATWGDILDSAPHPPVLVQLHQRINDVVAAGSELRRAEVAALLAEGVPKAKIANILGITHQRISQLSQDVEAAKETPSE